MQKSETVKRLREEHAAALAVKRRAHEIYRQLRAEHEDLSRRLLNEPELAAELVDVRAKLDAAASAVKVTGAQASDKLRLIQKREDYEERQRVKAENARARQAAQ